MLKHAVVQALSCARLQEQFVLNSALFAKLHQYRQVRAKKREAD